MNLSKQKAINKLGGLKCSGLSFIEGPNCPIPPELLKDYDINFAHRKAVMEGRPRSRKPEHEILKMENPEEKFILLCCLCNQRMRHLKKEFRYLQLPERVIKLYTDKQWSLEEIAQEYDCDYKTISNFLKRNNVTVRPGNITGGSMAWSRSQSREKLLTERRIRWSSPSRIKLAKEMYEMYNEGDSLREIAQWFGTTKASVKTHIKLIPEAQ